MPTRIVDLTARLEPATPVYPGDEPLRVHIVETTEDLQPDRRALNQSRLDMGLHCGTHMDSPFHFFSEGSKIDEIRLEQCVGATLLIRVPGSCDSGAVEVEDLKSHAERLQQLRKVVLNTGWSRHWDQAQYFTRHPLISGAAATFLVDCGVHLVGVDMPSVDRPPFEAHLELLGNDVVILENLQNLEQIYSDVFHLIALPLKLPGREASPIRAVAVENL